MNIPLPNQSILFSLLAALLWLSGKGQLVIPEAVNDSKPPVAYISRIWVESKPFHTQIVPTGVQRVTLGPGQRLISLQFGMKGQEQSGQTGYAYRLRGLSDTWTQSSMQDDHVMYGNLKPSAYTFEVKAILKDNKFGPIASLEILVKAAFWQTWWFQLLAVMLVLLAVAELFVWQLQVLRKKDKQELAIQRQMMELQDSALRAQMNPHFIFNCLSSIKALVQDGRNDTAVQYLTTFTKFIRSLMQNADQQYVSLDAEIETCRLYVALESLRFGEQFNYHFDIDPQLDLKSIEVPTLLLQPLIENAIWHGLIPKQDKGHLLMKVELHDDVVRCVVDDDGIGREAAIRMNGNRANHQSKGVSLTNKRIDLFRKIKEHDAAIEIIDKQDVQGKAAGTRIEITFSID